MSKPCLNLGLFFFPLTSDASRQIESIIRGLRSSGEPIRVPYWMMSIELINSFYNLKITIGFMLEGLSTILEAFVLELRVLTKVLKVN